MGGDKKLSKLGQRIEERRIQIGLTKDALQRGSKLSPNKYYQLLEGEIGQTSLRTFMNIAETLKLNVSELLGDEVFPEPAKDVKQQLDEITALLKQRHGYGEQAQKFNVAVWGNVAAGMGASNDAVMEEPELHIEIPARIEALPGRKMGYRVTGDSMVPQLHEGDILVVWYGAQEDVKARSRQGDVMVVTDSFNDEYVKRCYWNDKEEVLILQSVNPVYDDVTMEYENIKWTGLVVMTVRGDI